jgi:hypothetical protein
MNQMIEKRTARYEFLFVGLDCDPELGKTANLKLAQLLALAPPDATAFGTVSQKERYYKAEVEVKSRYRTFREQAAGTTPHGSVRLALEKIEDRLYRWRYGGGHDPSSQPARQVNVPQVAA